MGDAHCAISFRSYVLDRRRADQRPVLFEGMKPGSIVVRRSSAWDIEGSSFSSRMREHRGLHIPQYLQQHGQVDQRLSRTPLPLFPSSTRPSLAVNYTAHVADSQRFLLQGPLFSRTSARADSQKRRSPVPFRIASRARKRSCEGWTPMLALSYPNEASLCATAST
jgi:hypothetical protein